MNILTLAIIFPLIGFLLLAFSHNRWSENLLAIIGNGFIGLAALVVFCIGVNFFKSGMQPWKVPLWTWISIEDFNVGFDLILDELSLTMLSLVIGIGFLIHIFASWYMQGNKDYSRFFAYTNLFIFNMVVLVLADNLLLMYFGWEGVSLCSYLLIGFYFNNLKNSIAAIKAFIITRIGDIFLIFSFFILYNELETLKFYEIAESAKYIINKDIARWITLMLLFGVLGKSAQFPLHTWLPDAMVGPTPVSALIHSATMVTAGVYLIERTHNLFLVTPETLHLVSAIGATTLILAGLSASVQTDIKRILAYSTMSQIGYMFLALGAQAWHAAIFHLITHAFLKALLFLSSGSMIMVCNHEQNILHMKNPRDSIPLIYISFLIGSASLAAFPIVTSGFFSKEEIFSSAMANGHINLVVIGLIGTFITSYYISRMFFIIFHRKKQISTHFELRMSHYLPLVVLLILSTSFGILLVPSLKSVLLDSNKIEHSCILKLGIISGILTILGVLLSAWLWLGKRVLIKAISNNKFGLLLGTLLYNALGFDWIYNIIFVKPFLIFAKFLRNDPLNALMNILKKISRFISTVLLFSENGYLRWYIISMVASTIAVLLLLIFLS